MTAAFVTGIEGGIRGAVTEAGSNVVYDVVAAFFLLGVGYLLYVLPVFLGAAAVGRVADRRSENGLLALRLVLLVMLPFVAFPLALALDLPELLTYLVVLYGFAWARLRPLRPFDHPESARIAALDLRPGGSGTVGHEQQAEDGDGR